MVLSLIKKILGGDERKGKERRRLHRVESRPVPGEFIVRHQKRMKVTAPMSPELWDWLMLYGWRQVAVKRDRRRYQDLAPDTFRRISEANMAERERLHADIAD